MDIPMIDKLEALLNIPQVSLQLEHLPVNPEYLVGVSNSRQAVSICQQLWPDDINRIERMAMITFHGIYAVGFSWISQGGVVSTICDMRVVAQTALLQNASAVILCHNHPSGNEKPSQADNRLTKRAKEALSLLDITLTDHVIVCPNGRYYSYADEGQV